MVFKRPHLLPENNKRRFQYNALLYKVNLMRSNPMSSRLHLSRSPATVYQFQTIRQHQRRILTILKLTDHSSTRPKRSLPSPSSTYASYLLQFSSSRPNTRGVQRKKKYLLTSATHFPVIHHQKTGTHKLQLSSPL